MGGADLQFDKFCRNVGVCSTTYAKIIKIFQFLLSFLMCEANQSARGVWLRGARGANLKCQSGKRRRIPAAEKKASNRSLGQTTSEKWGEKNSCFLPAPYVIIAFNKMVSKTTMETPF